MLGHLPVATTGFLSALGLSFLICQNTALESQTLPVPFTHTLLLGSVFLTCSVT